jgi:branched-chain amino acid:cation transporter, LIVCS family
MKIDKGTPSLVIGMALFAMFFGSGNLIYPLYVGKIAQDQWMTMTIGFLIAAVLLPFLGVVAMVMYKGCYASFFNTIGRVPGFILSALLLTVWIPLGSAPRCMTLAYASLQSYFPTIPPLWIFSLVYSALVFIVISKKLGILDILGKWITPLLLICIGAVCYQGLFQSSGEVLGVGAKDGLVIQGIAEGYNTMDLIASFFFSASVIHILYQSGGSMKQSLSLMARSSIIGMGILATVYVCLIAVSAKHAVLLESVPKDQALAYLSQTLMGSTWSILAIIAIVLACFSTSIALILAYTDYLHDEIFKQSQHPVLSVVVALAVTFVMSLFGLQGITYVTAPVLKVCYPILIGLIVWNIGRRVLTPSSEKALDPS